MLFPGKSRWEQLGFNTTEAEYINKKVKEGEDLIIINRLTTHIFIQITDGQRKKSKPAAMELMRQAGCKITGVLNTHKYEQVTVAGAAGQEDSIMALAEGCILGNYRFMKYKSDRTKGHTLQKVGLMISQKMQREVDRLNIVCDAVYKARDLVNEPQSYLDAVKFSEEIQQMGKHSGFRVEVLHKKQIEALKMGGLLAVNMGSKTPPTFTIMEYKPRGAKNKKPYVLVGKGVVYDTGGLSLKPTPNSMDTMKCDMAGGAVVAATMAAIAQAKLPLHVIGLVPATDNRPGENAYTPGDVIHMYDGQTVEVLNTDAEGRMLLADALAYAKKYSPALVMDFATLTGAAAAAIGSYGMVCMGNADERIKSRLHKSGDAVYERLAEFPFWEEYAKLINSDLADMKNIGGPVAGAITAGKFLEKYTDYPWMHFDIAGPAFLNSADSYRGKQGTGYGVRFLFHFFSQLAK